MFLRVCALSLWEGRCHQGLLRSLLGAYLDVVCIPYTQRSDAQVLCACVCPNHGNSSTGLQHQQQQHCSFASVVPSPATRAGKPYSCGGQDVAHSSSTTLSGIVKTFFFIMLTTKHVLVVHFRTDSFDGVAPCSGFKYHVRTHNTNKILNTLSDRGVWCTWEARTKL